MKYRDSLSSQIHEDGDAEGKGLGRTGSNKGLKYLNPNDVPNYKMFDSSNLNAIKKVKKMYKSSVYSEKQSVGESNHGSDVDYDDDDNVIPKDGKPHRRTKSQGRRAPREGLGDAGSSKKILTRKEKIKLLEKEKAMVEKKIQLLEHRRKQRLSLKSSSTPKPRHKNMMKGLGDGPVKPRNDKEILTSLHAHAEGEPIASRDSGMERGVVEDLTVSKFSKKSQKKKKKRRNSKNLEVFSSMESSQFEPKMKKRKMMDEDKHEGELVEGARIQRELENISRPKSRKSKKRPRPRRKSSKKREKIQEFDEGDLKLNPIEFSDEGEKQKPKKKKRRKKKKQSNEASAEVVSQPPMYKSSIGEMIRKSKKKSRNTVIKEDKSIFNPKRKEKPAKVKKGRKKKERDNFNDDRMFEVEVISPDENSWDEFG